MDYKELNKLTLILWIFSVMFAATCIIGYFIDTKNSVFYFVMITLALLFLATGHYIAEEGFIDLIKNLIKKLIK